MIPVQYIISSQQKLSPLSHIKCAVKAGCKWIQFNPTGLSTKEAQKIATKAKDLCRKEDVTFIIENDIELVKTIDGDGVHITDGTPLSNVRQLLGEGFLIGGMASSAEDVITLKKQSADYICCGPFSSHQTEDSENTLLSCEDFVKIIQTIEDKQIFLPLCAYGDILPSDVDVVMQTGMRGIAIQITESNLTEDLVKNTLEQYLSL